MRAAAALAAVAAIATAGTAAAIPPRTYRVTIHATLQERATYALTGDAACFWSARGVAVRHLEIATTAPVTLTSAQLDNGVGVPLEIHEIRLANHNNVIGACTRLGPEISDPTDRCGRRSYRVPASAVRLRLDGDRLTFSFVREAPDPYGNHCAPSEWGAVPQSGHANLVATLRFPPQVIAAPLTTRGSGSHRQSDATSNGSFSTADSTLGRTDVTAYTWQVALTFV
jgi:hypothetical protein